MASTRRSTARNQFNALTRALIDQEGAVTHEQRAALLRLALEIVESEREYKRAGSEQLEMFAPEDCAGRLDAASFVTQQKSFLGLIL